MKAIRLAVVLAALVALGGMPARAGLPTPEPAVTGLVRGGACTPPDSSYEFGGANYGSKCERLKVVFGPIWAKPGQNEVLIQPITFEKPLYDGYLIRFKPDLVSVLPESATNPTESIGTPPVEQIHLHHGTWLNAGRSYGSGPWIATGEEKTIAVWPKGFGLKILGSDTWLFLHMVHNALPTTRPVWVTYDLDMVRAADAEALQPDGEPLLRNTKGIWLDVGGGKYHPTTDLFNPIFNAQKGHGVINPETGRWECVFPKMNCAEFNVDHVATPQQGVPETGVKGVDVKVTKDYEGTLVMMGGHVHFGGLRDEVSLVRNGVEKPILVSDAYYWDFDQVHHPNRIGAPPISWDMSMTGSTLDLGWAVNIKEGDILRLNGVYDTDIGSWYAQMGIVMTWVVPKKFFGVDPFDPAVTIDPGISTLARVPNGPDGNPLPQTCTPSATRLCLRGQVTHGHVATSGNHSEGVPTPLPGAGIEGPMVTDIPISGFAYGPADIGVIGLNGIPRVKVNTPVTFWNADTADYVWHSVTRCAAPCTGATTASYPIAGAGAGGTPDLMDFDSSDLGVGPGAWMPNGTYPQPRTSWTFKPTRTGTFTFFCRIHPGMRGAIKVINA